ncbi:hypothetical protein ACE3NQ_17525 [Paenibacillus terreus]|uniref:50S ribosomal protein L17 n=1 Tax=Paenibacillus terreus TaxID=1387834 RepID=A0ABV5BDV1_9BACL
MSTRHSSILLLNDAGRSLKKARRLLVEGKYKRAKKNIVSSMTLLGHVLVKLDRFTEVRHRVNMGRVKNE